MAFGRLEVYFPDGRLETYMLHQDTVSIGRADGNIIPLDTDTISRYHFSLEHQAGVVSITDLESQNGTFVDGIQLTPNQPHVLGDVEEIMVGSLRIIFRLVDDQPTLNLNVINEETQRMEVGESNLRVELDYTNLKVWPAASSSAELAITNTGDETREFAIHVSGIPSGWLRLTRPQIELSPNETAYILLNIKPPRRSNTVPQHYHVTVEVAPISETSASVVMPLDVEIMAYSGFGMALGKQLDIGESIPVFLHNQGSGTMKFTMSASDPKNALKFHLPTTPLELQAGQRLKVELQIDAKTPPLVGNPQMYAFVVQVQSHDASRFIAANDGYVMIKPRVPIWGAMAAVGIALSMIIIALLAVFGVLNNPQPVINDIAVDTLEVEQGEDLTISVDTDDVDTYDVLVNQIVTHSAVSSEQETVVVDTDSLAGNITIEVIARNGSESVRSSVTAYVFVPLAVIDFTVSPNPLIRNTVNTLTVSWDVSGAVFVRLSGLGDFTNNRISSSTEYQGTESLLGIGGIPEQPLTLTLYAEDEFGASLSQSLTIPLVDPICTALDTIIVREGPDELYPQVATIEATVPVAILAQDADAAWLRVQLAGDVRGWAPTTAFTCADNFELVNLATEFNVPELPATPVPAPVQPTVEPTPARSNTGN